MDDTESSAKRAIAQIAYDASVGALASQEGQLSALHARASFLLAAAGIATGTVLGRVSGTLNRSGLVAIVAFGVTAVAATIILLPRRKAWIFTTNAATVLTATDARPTLTDNDVLRWLANSNQDHYTANARQLNRLYSLLVAGCIALVVAIVASIVSLGV